MIEDSLQPLVSVVTVSYNAVDTIEETILSVLNQTYKNIEYILVDGGSTDGTVDIIKKYADKIAYWVSEPDKGIYDAMNKGIDVATGEWINFMNSGDIFYSNIVIEKIIERVSRGIAVIYGDVILKYSWGNVLKKALPINIMNRRFPFSHQSCFINITFMKELKYDTSFKICADYNFFYKLYYENKCHFLYVDSVVSVFESEQGVSSVNYLIMKSEDGRIHKKTHEIKWKLYIFFLGIYLKITSNIKSIMPTKMLVYYHKSRYGKM